MVRNGGNLFPYNTRPARTFLVTNDIASHGTTFDQILSVSPYCVTNKSTFRWSVSNVIGLVFLNSRSSGRSRDPRAPFQNSAGAQHTLTLMNLPQTCCKYQSTSLCAPILALSSPCTKYHSIRVPLLKTHGENNPRTKSFCKKLSRTANSNAGPASLVPHHDRFTLPANTCLSPTSISAAWTFSLGTSLCGCARLTLKNLHDQRVATFTLHRHHRQQNRQPASRGGVLEVTAATSSLSTVLDCRVACRTILLRNSGLFECCSLSTSHQKAFGLFLSNASRTGIGSNAPSSFLCEVQLFLPRRSQPV